MGTITRALANNITTGGVVSASGISNTSVSAVTSLPSGVDVGDFVLISEQTASASASLSFTSGLDSTYDAYCFKFINIHPATDGTAFHFNGSTDGGSNYNVTKTSSFFQAYHSESDSVTSLGYGPSEDLAQSTSYQILFNDLGNASDENGSGELWLFNPSSTTYVKHFMGTSNRTNLNDISINTYYGGYFNTTSAIDAIDFKMASGNIDAGTIKLFGVKKT